MNVEVVALTVTLGVSVLGNVGTFLYWTGKVKATVENLSEELKQLDIDNKAAHKTIYSSQEATGKAVSKIEEHLRNLNSSVEKNSKSIDICKEAIQKNTERIFTHSHSKG